LHIKKKDYYYDKLIDDSFFLCYVIGKTHSGDYK